MTVWPPPQKAAASQPELRSGWQAPIALDSIDSIGIDGTGAMDAAFLDIPSS